MACEKGRIGLAYGLLIGNGISLIAAVFTAKSSWARDNRHIYLYQVAQCLLLALASLFFGSYAGIVTLLACALRNYLASMGKLDGRMVLLCLFLVTVPGIAVNNRGAVGLIVITANVLYTLGMYLARGEKTVKCNIMLNLVLWMIYEALIVDIPSFTADGIALFTAAASLLRSKKDRPKEV